MTNGTVTVKTQQPKHREVADTLRIEIESDRWKVGERLPGEQELAKRFKVAYTTMRQSIANLVGEGLLCRVRGKGTYVVSHDHIQPGPRTRHQMVLLFPAESQRIDPYYFPEVLDGFQQTVENGGYHMALYPSDVAENPGILAPGAAVAFLMFEESHLQLVERLRDSGYLVLAINHYTGRRSIPSVWIDDAYGIERAVDHLVSLEHERIGFLCGPATNLDAIDRLRGFRAAVKRHDLRFAPEAGHGFGEAAGYAAARKLISGPNRPTAIVCASDLAAIGAMRAAHDYGISVPRGLSIIGFGDFSVADYVLPRLTTVKQSRIALGRAAAEALIQIASDLDTPGEILTPDLILRESTAKNIVG